ncbi:MAG: polysaccharide biosynthesis C-terminal domain-containing protein, partial [Patescibacteria group bacterium]
SFILSFYSTIRGYHTLFWESVGVILFQFTIAVLGVATSFVTHDVRWFMLALALSVVIHFIYAYWQIKFRYQVFLWPEFNLSKWRAVAKLAWPFALAAVLLRVYGYVDTVLLSVLSSEEAVGFYSVAYKVTFALQFIPTAFAASLFPGFSAYFKNAKDGAPNLNVLHQSDDLKGRTPRTSGPSNHVTNEWSAWYRGKLTDSFAHSLVYLTAIAVPVSFGLAVLAPVVVAALYPRFTASVQPLQILMLSLPLLFATFPIGSLLAACNRQTRNTGNIAIATAVSVVANLLLIPKFGPVGAALASFLGTITLLIAGALVVKQIITVDSKWLFYKLVKILIAGLVMAVVTWLLVQQIHFILVIIISTPVYLFLVIKLGGVSWQELINFYHILKQKSLPLRDNN